jgi:hypothetical protein
MIVNKIKIVQSNSEKELIIPVSTTFGFLGQEDAITQYESNIVDEIINPIDDFEVTRFSHKEYSSTATSCNYEFYFFNGDVTSPPVNVTATTNTNNWVIDYTGATFTDNELYYFADSFKRSFFKLDFYDSVSADTQQLYFTVIIPTYEGETKTGYIGVSPSFTQVDVKKPKFILDFLGDKEGFFFYWLKNRTYLDITNFFMSAKFFNAKIGQFTRMMTTPQGLFPSTDKFTFNPENYFYYGVNMDYNDYEYDVYDILVGTRVGTTSTPIKWYEYVNP